MYAPSEEEKNDLEVMLYHEATHQLFRECQSATSTKARKKKLVPVGQLHNFWITEGIATYMETFQQRGNHYHVGGNHSLRFQRARERCSEQGGYVPLREFSLLSLERFQSNPENLPMYYTQATGLTNFFLHHENGKYRNAFIVALFLVYEEMDKANMLEQLTGRSFEQLDSEYQEFMRQSPEW